MRFKKGLGKMAEEKEVKEKKKRRYDPGRFAVRIIALVMAVCMVFAVAATGIFYIMYYMK